MNRAELIASLVTDKYSGFKDGDEPLLEAASDARLMELRAAADTAKVAVSEKETLVTNLKNTQARLKVAEDRIKESETELSEADFIARAPSHLKTLIEAEKSREANEKAELVSALKTCNVKSEDELKRLSIPELKTLAKFARLQVNSYMGKGFPVERAAEENVISYAPPDPYQKGIEALRAGK